MSGIMDVSTTLGQNADWGKFMKNQRQSTNVEDRRNDPPIDPIGDLILETGPKK